MGVLSGERVLPSEARAIIYVRNATGVVIEGITIIHNSVRAIRAYGSKCNVTNVKVSSGGAVLKTGYVKTYARESL